MATALISDADFRRHFVGTNPVSAYAKSIDQASQELLAEAMRLRTVNDALRLYHVAAGLRDRLEAVAAAALIQSDALCGGNKVLATITPETPWGEPL
jgi:hypothetical protein